MPARTGKVAAITDLVLEVFELNGRLLRAGDNLVRDVGLSSARWQVLGTVATRPASMAAIGRRMGRARQSVREVAEKLAAEGLVSLVPDESDRRAPRLEISERGHELLHQVAPRQIRWARWLAQGCSASELDTTVKVLRRLGLRLASAEGDAP